MSGYRADVTVVRKRQYTESWVADDDAPRQFERAYLVRGLPMPGTKVLRGLTPLVAVGIATPDVRLDGSGTSYPTRFAAPMATLTPYDPEAEKVKRVARALKAEDERAAPGHRPGIKSWEEFARAAIAAMKDEP